MARSHGVIKNEVWETGSDFRQLPLDGQWCYAMLVSQPQINNLGIVPYLPEKWARLAADQTLDRLNAALAALEHSRFTITDVETRELLVRTFIRHDKVWSQPALVTNARRLIREVESDRIYGYLTTRHPWLLEETWTAARITKHEQGKRLPETPLDTPSQTPPETPSQTPPETPLEEEPDLAGSAAEKTPLETPPERGVASRARAQDPQPLPLPQDQPQPRSSTTQSETKAVHARDPGTAQRPWNDSSIRTTIEHSLHPGTSPA